jgi:hypothetical protein
MKSGHIGPQFLNGSYIFDSQVSIFASLSSWLSQLSGCSGQPETVVAVFVWRITLNEPNNWLWRA